MVILLAAASIMFGGLLCDDALAQQIQAETYAVGVAAVDITPEHPIRLNGFGGRRQESNGIRQPIWAKAIAIGTDAEGPAVLITVDILGIPDALVTELAERLAKQSAVTRERLTLTATHTHSAPMLEGENETLFGEPIPDEHLQHISHYTRVFLDKLEQVALEALADREPANLHWGIGSVGFAINRRTAGGPVDHDLPLLTVRSLDGDLRAVYFSHACHCVTLSDNQISGDWAGYAQAAVERDFPGAVALCSVGCGADSNPNSGVTGDRADIAISQGEEIASEVRRLLDGYLAPVQGEVTSHFERVTLPLQTLPDRAAWEARAEQENAVGHHARVQLARLDRGIELILQIEAPIQSWQFGDSLAIVFLPGETVVDYSLRLKRELDAQRVWINGYANAACGYVPSERVLNEGGYEGGDAMIYYDIPAPYAPGLEQKIIDAVHSQVGGHFAARVDVSRTNGLAPLSPQQSAARIRSRAEMEVQLVAAEPLVVDPVAIDFGPDGRMWVAEMHDYPEGIARDFQPGGRVRLVRDTNGDGVFDAATVFLDDIPFPTGVTVWRDGVLVCAAPDILYAEDTDGDDIADVKRVLFSGFGTGNYQGRVNSLVPGLDGWVYGSCGLFGGEIISFAGGDPLALGDRDFRIQPDSGRIEPATGRTQQGRVRDDWGNWFGCNSGAVLFHLPLADHDLRRNPYLSAPPAEVHLAPSSTLFPAMPPLTFALSGPPGLTTAACGLGIYRDDLLGAEFTGNSFTCEPVSQVVHRLRVTSDGSTFTAQRADDEWDREFLASLDGWSRPVQARTGPDGALWVVDMYRYIIEHPRWIPAEDIARVDLRAGDTMGRIYRVFPRENPPRAIERLSDLDSAELVAALDSPNGPQRDLAGQLLLWRDDQSFVPALTEMVEQSPRAEARLHALVTLEGLDAIRSSLLSGALHDPHPGVRRQAVRIAGERLDTQPELLTELLALVRESDAIVRVELAASLGAADDPGASRALVDLLHAHPDDPFLAAAVMSSITPDNVSKLLDAALSGDAPPHSSLIAQLLTMAAATDNTDALRKAVAAIIAPETEPYSTRQAASLASLLQTLSDRDLQLAEVLGEEVAARVAGRLADLRRIAGDRDSDEEARISALRVLGRDATSREADLDVLRDRLAAHESMEIQLAAVEALGRIDAPRSLELLLAGWSSATPQVRGAIFDAAVDRPEWLSRVLAELEQGRIPAVDLDAARAARLREHPDDAARQRAHAIFEQIASSDRSEVYERYQAAAELDGDADRGATLFQKSCSVCHRLNEVGHAVGPDLAPLAGKTADYLLLAMMDPSRAVDNRYLNYNVALADGRIVTGMLAAESSSSITLAMQEGKQETILRRDIDELRSTGKSMMPEGIERDLSVQDVADVIAYLKTPQSREVPPDQPIEGNHPSLIEPDDAGRLLLLATNGSLHGDSIIFEQPFRNIGYWHAESDHVDWSVRVPHDASCDAWLVYACDDTSAGNNFVLEGGSEPIRGAVPGTGGWSQYERLLIGTIDLVGGEHTITLRPDGPLAQRALMDLHGLELVPTGNEPQLAPPEPIDAFAVAIPSSINPREIANQLLDESLSVEHREALIAAHERLSPDLIAALSENLPSGAEEYRRIPWIWRIAIAAGRRNQDHELRSILSVSLPGPDRLCDWQAVVIGGGVVNGVSQQQVWPRDRIASLLVDDAALAARWARLLELAAGMADDEQVATGTRYDALRILGCGSWEAGGARLQEYLTEGTDAELQMGAVSGLADLDSPESTTALAAALSHLTDTNRSLAIAGLMRSSDRIHALLDAIENGTLRADELDADQLESLGTHSDSAIQRRAREILP
jgi:putative membrane-bound dehydrogenase-like protein